MHTAYRVTIIIPGDFLPALTCRIALELDYHGVGYDRGERLEVVVE